MTLRRLEIWCIYALHSAKLTKEMSIMDRQIYSFWVTFNQGSLLQSRHNMGARLCWLYLFSHKISDDPHIVFSHLMYSARPDNIEMRDPPAYLARCSCFLCCS